MSKIVNQTRNLIFTSEYSTGSIPGRTCRPSRSEFSVVFSETRINPLGSFRKTPTKCTLPTGPGPTNWQLVLNLQPTEYSTYEISRTMSLKKCWYFHGVCNPRYNWWKLLLLEARIFLPVFFFFQETVSS